MAPERPAPKKSSVRKRKRLRRTNGGQARPLQEMSATAGVVRLESLSASHSFSPICTKAGLLRLDVLRCPIVTFADLFAGGKAASPEFSG
jgi:hypothetical protein